MKKEANADLAIVKAVDHGYTDVVRVILGAPGPILRLNDAMVRAVHQGNLPITKLLIENGVDGNPALRYAQELGNFPIFQFIIDGNPTIAVAPIVLCDAATSGRIQFMMYLIDNAPFCLTGAKDTFRVAVTTNNIDVVELLIDRVPSDLLDIEPSIDIAITSKHDEVAEVIFSSPAAKRHVRKALVAVVTRSLLASLVTKANQHDLNAAMDRRILSDF